MSWRIWRRCSMEGSMIWERCKRDEPATGLGRSLFTPLPRHASVLDCERTSGQFLCSDNVGCNVQKPTSPRRNSCHHEHESVSLAADEATGTYGSNEQSYEDADEQRSGRGQFSAQGERSHGFHGGRRGASRRCVERGAVERGGSRGGGAGAVRDGREGDGEMHLSEDRVRNTRGTFFPQPLQTSTIPIPDPTCMLLYPRHATVSQCTTYACHCPGSSSRQHA